MQEIEGQTEKNDRSVGKDPSLELLRGRRGGLAEKTDGGIQVLIVKGVGSFLGDGDGGDVLEVGEED